MNEFNTNDIYDAGYTIQTIGSLSPEWPGVAKIEDVRKATIK